MHATTMTKPPHGWTEEQYRAKTGGEVKLQVRSWRDVPVFVLMLPVKFYQRFVGPFLPEMCRYEPTCSSFMLHAIQQKGIFWGPIIGIIRVLRCNPFFPGGYDPVEAWWPFPTGKHNHTHDHTHDEGDNVREIREAGEIRETGEATETGETGD